MLINGKEKSSWKKSDLRFMTSHDLRKNASITITRVTRVICITSINEE